MGKLEREVKILGVNKIKLERILEQLGAEKVEECLQKIYVYDLPSIYSRFCDCLLQLKKVNKPYEFEICRNKLQGVLNENRIFISRSRFTKYWNGKRFI